MALTDETAAQIEQFAQTWDVPGARVQDLLAPLLDEVTRLTISRDQFNSEASAHLAEVQRYRAHSVTLNSIGWKIATALGDVPEGADQITGNPEAQADRLISEVHRLRLAHTTVSFALDESGRYGRWAEAELERLRGELVKVGRLASGAIAALPKAAPSADESSIAIDESSVNQPGPYRVGRKLGRTGDDKTTFSIDEAIAQWHDDSTNKQALHEYLGMTWEQYQHWFATQELPEGSPFARIEDGESEAGR